MTMTVEEKAKAFDEALERARKMLNMILDNELIGFPDQIREIFPQLCESEDESIRKEIINFFKNFKKTGTWKSISDVNTWIAYLEKQEEQKPVECIEFDNEFEKQVSHLLASVLNGEWEYDEGFVKHAAQSLLGYAKNEMKPDEWDKREKLFRKALQAANARIGQLFEENQKLKEQKQEWSEEDEEHRKFILELLEDQIRFCKKDAEGAWHAKQIRTAQNWFKFLRPQPHTVSVKDATKFGNLEYERGVKDGIQSEKSRQWKPSKEQMDSLRDTIINTKGYSYSIYLPELYEQLNKNLNHEELPAGAA